MQDAITHVEGFRGLKDNWDTYGAQPIDEGCIKRAIGMLKSFPEDVPVPWPAPCSSGGIQFEWNTMEMALEFEISPDGSAALYFTESRPDHKRTVTQELKPGHNMEEFYLFLSRFQK